MSKSSIGGRYALTTSYVSLATLLGTTGMWKGDVAIDDSHAYTFFLKSANNTDASPAEWVSALQVAAGVGWSHEYGAVDLSTISVAGLTAGDFVSLAGEGVQVPAYPDSVY